MSRSPERVSEIGPYIATEVIGMGSTGKVKLAHHKETQRAYAIKILSKSIFENSPQLVRKTQREIALMRVINHPNVLKLHDILESSRNLYIVLEYAQNGDLLNYVTQSKIVHDDMTWEIFRQLVLGIEYLHSHGICHRDLKLENILMDKNHNVKIADFGFAKWINNNVAETVCGSPHFTAPEVISGCPYDPKKADIWSLGIILYTLLAGYLPFTGESVRSVFHRVKKGVYTIPESFDLETKDLISHLINTNSSERYSLNDIKNHKCFRKGIDPRYILPSPIPINAFSMPVDPSTITNEIKNLLVSIGFDDEAELEAQLQSASTTMAKVFVEMFSAKLDLETLPWDSAFKNGDCNEENEMFVEDITITKNGDQFFHSVPTNHPSLGVRSFPERPEWANEKAFAETIIQEVTFESKIKKIWVLMFHIQEIFMRYNLHWFHPDLLTYYMKTHDNQAYMSIKAEYHEQSILLNVSFHKGMIEPFQNIVDTIEAELVTNT